MIKMLKLMLLFGSMSTVVRAHHNHSASCGALAPTPYAWLMTSQKRLSLQISHQSFSFRESIGLNEVYGIRLLHITSLDASYAIGKKIRAFFRLPHLSLGAENASTSIAWRTGWSDGFIGIRNNILKKDGYGVFLNLGTSLPLSNWEILEQNSPLLPQLSGTYNPTFGVSVYRKSNDRSLWQVNLEQVLGLVNSQGLQTAHLSTFILAHQWKLFKEDCSGASNKCDSASACVCKRPLRKGLYLNTAINAQYQGIAKQFGDDIPHTGGWSTLFQGGLSIAMQQVNVFMQLTLPIIQELNGQQGGIRVGGLLGISFNMGTSKKDKCESSKSQSN